jgi:hypothetical protein
LNQNENGRVDSLMKRLLAAIPLVFLLSAVACSKNQPVNEDAENATGIDQVVAEANATAEAVHNEADDTPPAPVTNQQAPEIAPPTPGALIPAQYQGRWGMVPADCTSTKGDAKGLITVGDTSIKFYESTATLMEQRPAKATSFSGVFAFTGEGERWQKVMTLTRSGNSLERADKEGSFTYKRCA